jgi:hypothetical protein
VFAPEDVAEASPRAAAGFRLSSGPAAPTAAIDRAVPFLAPERPAVPIQLWTLRRIGVTTCVVLAVLVTAVAVYAYARVAGLV